MLKIFGILLMGVLIGILFRSKLSLNILSRLTTYLIYLLLLVLGVAVGANDNIVNNLSTIGLKGTIIAISAVLGSLIMAKLLFVLFYKNSNNEG